MQLKHLFSNFNKLFFSVVSKGLSSPYINHFLQPDSIIPSLYNPQALNRFSYVLNNPLRYSDPSGHRECEMVSGGGCMNGKKLNLWNYATDMLIKWGGKDDVEGAVRIIDKAVNLYGTMDKIIPELTEIFNGFHESNPLTIVRLLGVDGCAGVGRDPRDCDSNTDDMSFWDKGFSEDFQDNHNQIFHYWAYLATTASTDYPVGGYALGYLVGQAGNLGHEILGIGDPKGASWQDYALAEAGINTGVMISLGLISPNELSEYVRNDLTMSVPYVSPLIQRVPLPGNR
jgi:hypothetical protein